MKVSPSSVEVDLEDGRSLVIHDSFIELHYTNKHGNVFVSNVQMEKLFKFAEAAMEEDNER